MLATRGCAAAEITCDDKSTGVLFHVKTTVTASMPADVHVYRSANPTVPDPTTADPFFDEDQLEACRELGYRLT